VVLRGGAAAGAHPRWEQQFLFELGHAPPNLDAPTPHTCASPSGKPRGITEHDGLLHIRLYDKAAPGAGSDVCIGRLDLNIAALLAPAAPDAPAPPRSSSPGWSSPSSPRSSSSSSSGVIAGGAPTISFTQWHKVCDARNLRHTAGWLCLTAAFEGTGLASAEGVATGVAGSEANGAAKATSPVVSGSTTPSAASAAQVHPVYSLLTSPRSSIIPPRPESALLGEAAPGAPQPPPSDASSLYFAPPRDGWPTPLQPPPAPGYPVPGPVSAARPASAMQMMSPRAVAAAAAAAAAAATMGRPQTAAAPATATSLQSSLQSALSAAAADDADPASPALITAFDVRHEHILQLVPRVDKGLFLCASCHGEGRGAAYHCTAGCDDFDVHEECLRERADGGKDGAEMEEQQEDEKKYCSSRGGPSRASGAAPASGSAPDMRHDGRRRHHHPLTWLARSVAADGLYLCGGCGGGGSGPTWHCHGQTSRRRQQWWGRANREAAKASHGR
jgi:hypothetical protein